MVAVRPDPPGHKNSGWQQETTDGRNFAATGQQSRAARDVAAANAAEQEHRERILEQAHAAAPKAWIDKYQDQLQHVRRQASPENATRAGSLDAVCASAAVDAALAIVLEQAEAEFNIMMQQLEAQHYESVQLVRMLHEASAAPIMHSAQPEPTKALKESSLSIESTISAVDSSSLTEMQMLSEPLNDFDSPNPLSDHQQYVGQPMVATRDVLETDANQPNSVVPDSQVQQQMAAEPDVLEPDANLPNSGDVPDAQEYQMT